MNKKIMSAGLAVGLLAGGGAGLILELAGSAGASGRAAGAATQVADTTPTTGQTTTVQKTLDRTTRLQDILKPLVDDKTITQAQADKVIAAIVAARPTGGFPGGGRGFGPVVGAGLDVVASTLNITVDDVRTALRNGQTIAQLAESKGKTAQDVVDAVVAAAKKRLADAVTAGKMTQTQADQFLAEVTTRATDFVNGKLPTIGARGMGGPWMGPGMHGMHPGDGDDGLPGDAGSTGATDTTSPATTTG